MKRIDKAWIGMLIGLMVPLLFGLVYLDRMNLWQLMRHFSMDMLGIVPAKIIMLSIFPNLAFVFVFYTLEMWRFSRGLLAASMCYLVLAIACLL